MQNKIYRYIKTNNVKRKLFISDIHGNFLALKTLLEESYNKDTDELFILGDLIEKGSENLNTLRYVMELSKNTGVYIVQGNCDSWVKYILDEDIIDELKEYALYRKESLLNEMADEIGMHITADSDMLKIIKAIKENYHDELSFITNLPCIIESDRFVIAHAGVSLTNFSETTFLEATKSDDFNTSVNKRFDKLVILGHWTSGFYNKGLDFKPYYNFKTNVLFIDGANVVATCGQLNLLIISKFYPLFFELITYNTTNRTVIVNKNQEYSGAPFSIRWPLVKATVIKDIDEDQALYRLDLASTRGASSLKPVEIILYKELVVDGEVIEHSPEFLELERDEEITLIHQGVKVSIIKKYSYVALALNDNLDLK